MNLEEYKFWKHTKRGQRLLMIPLKNLLDASIGTSIDTSLTLLEKLKLLLESFKEYASRLGEKTRKEIEEKIEEKRLLEFHDKCALAHKNVENNL
jgi:hypothetical protein